MYGGKALGGSDAETATQLYRVMISRGRSPAPNKVQVSMTALRAFEAVARLSSVTRAAEELGRTQGAISRQIALLEDRLGVALFNRTRQQLILTDLGWEFLCDVEQILDKVAESTRRIIARQQNAGKLNLAVSPAFAPQWLMARLPTFTKRHADLRLDMVMREGPFDLLQEQIDVAIFYGRGMWKDAIVEPLTQNNLIAVRGPKLRLTGDPLYPETWLRLPLLQKTGVGSAWAAWFKMLGLDQSAKRVKAEFEQLSVVVEAAEAGLGVALVPEFFVAEALAKGDLLRVSQMKVRDPQQYFIAYAQSSASNADIRAFCDWIRSEVGEEERERFADCHSESAGLNI